MTETDVRRVGVILSTEMGCFRNMLRGINAFAVKPLEEIRRVRIERAKQLLAQTDSPMPRVAAECGFSSAAWFSRVFHDLAGETPSQYRQRSRVR